MSEGKDRQSTKAVDMHSRKIRYGAPDGPRKSRRENYDGRKSHEYPGHEAAAWFLAVPKPLREFKSIAALAKQFRVSRMTIHRWTQDVDVLTRANWLSIRNKMAGDLVARREHVSIMEKATEMAKKGNIAAMKFCAERAFPEDKQAEKSGLTPLSIEEVLQRAEDEYEKHSELMTPTWLKERAKRLGYGMPQSKGIQVPEKSEPEVAASTPAETAAVNACDACGNARCAHGRCPVCETCEVCQ